MRFTVTYLGESGKPESMVIEGTQEQAKMVMGKLELIEPRPARAEAFSIREYVIERLFGVKRINGGFV